ncbi:MAG: hypothetical protein ABR543_02865 [Gemmatimonadaceae bacterium]
MSRFFAAGTLTAGHIALTVLVLVWNLAISGRIARARGVPRALGGMSAVAGLVIAPALFALLASGSVSAGRALHTLAWLWPATVLLIAAQSVYAAARNLAAPPIGVPIAAYNVVLSIISIARYALSRGDEIPQVLLWLVAADNGALGLAGATSAVLNQMIVHIPILAPISPPRRGPGTPLRGAVAGIAAVWLALIAVAFPGSALAVESYRRYADDRMQERPDGDFVIGIKILPRVDRVPPEFSLGSDLSLAESLGARALSVYLASGGVTRFALDSLAHALEQPRTNAILLAGLEVWQSRDPSDSAVADMLESRVADVKRIADRLRPAYLIPAVEPLGTASRLKNTLPMDALQGYLHAAAAAARGVDERIKIMVHVSGIGTSDSALFAWAARAGSPVDAVSLSLYPWYNGAVALDERMATVDRWMLAEHPAKEIWVLEAAGLPLSHGELSQERAIWGALAWATSRSAVKGFIIYQASDRDAPVGLRAPGGRVRNAALAIAPAARMLRETIR